MKAFFLAALIIGAGPASSAEWKMITSSSSEDGNRTYIEADEDSVRERPPYRQAWIRYSYLKPKKNETDGKPYRSTAALTLFDCKNEELTDLATLDYSSMFGAGEARHSTTTPRALAVRNLRPVVPDSVGENILQWACTRQPK